MEYCGEVMDYRDFQERAELYDRENRRHYYFMTLRADEVLYTVIFFTPWYSTCMYRNE